MPTSGATTRFFNIPERQTQRQEQSAGSGVTVDSDAGIVLTNYHVVRNADELQVHLVDERAFQAQMRGADPDLDIAVLEIDAEDLSEVPLADSSRLRVGTSWWPLATPSAWGRRSPPV